MRDAPLRLRKSAANAPNVRLNEMGKIEWYDLARKFMPGVTEAQFTEMWVEFQAEKAQKALS